MENPYSNVNLFRLAMSKLPLLPLQDSPLYVRALPYHDLMGADELSALSDKYGNALIGKIKPYLTEVDVRKMSAQVNAANKLLNPTDVEDIEERLNRESQKESFIRHNAALCVDTGASYIPRPDRWFGKPVVEIPMVSLLAFSICFKYFLQMTKT